MLFQNLIFAFALSAVGLAQDVEDSDIPNQCRSVCASVVQVSRDCDRRFDGDRRELECQCQAANMNTQVPICEACVHRFDDDDDDDDDDHDNDVYDLLTSCSFSTTTYNPNAPSASVTQVTGAPSASNSIVVPTSVAPTSRAVPGTTGGISQRPSATTSGPLEQSTAAAPTMGVGAAGVGMGMLGLALGMM